MKYDTPMKNGKIDFDTIVLDICESDTMPGNEEFARSVAKSIYNHAVAIERAACANIAKQTELTEEGDAATCRLIEDRILTVTGINNDPLRAPKND